MLPIFILILLASVPHLHAKDRQILEDEDCSDEKCQAPSSKLSKPGFREKSNSHLDEENSEYPLAKECSRKKCQLPDCRCYDEAYPKPEFEDFENKIPQFITVTFDDAINIMNYPIYEEIFKGLKNSDNCSARGTFFVSHEYSDYSKINALYNDGHEIALHSITHSIEKNYWNDASVDLIMREFGDQFEMLETFAYVNRNHIRGMRLPFLQTCGNNSFIAGKKLGLLYDASLPTTKFKHPPMWPYTLDYRTEQDCHVGPCPNVAIPGFWVSPMVSFTDVERNDCSMMDSCFYLPEDDVDEIVKWMMDNFNRHYETNHAPFGMYLHASLFDRTDNYVQAFRKFLQHATTLPNVYVATMSQVIQYMRNPVLGKPFKSCPKRPETKKCTAKTCRLPKVATKEVRYITLCGQCPKVYPWLGNPLGLKMDEE